MKYSEVVKHETVLVLLRDLLLLEGFGRTKVDHAGMLLWAFQSCGLVRSGQGAESRELTACERELAIHEGSNQSLETFLTERQTAGFRAAIQLSSLEGLPNSYAYSSDFARTFKNERCFHEGMGFIMFSEDPELKRAQIIAAAALGRNFMYGFFVGIGFLLLWEG